MRRRCLSPIPTSKPPCGSSWKLSSSSTMLTPLSYRLPFGRLAPPCLHHPYRAPATPPPTPLLCLRTQLPRTGVQPPTSSTRASTSGPSLGVPFVPPSLAPSSAPPSPALTRLVGNSGCDEVLAPSELAERCEATFFWVWPSFRPCLNGFCVDSPIEWYGGGRLVRQHAELLVERVVDHYQTVPLVSILSIIASI